MISLHSRLKDGSTEVRMILINSVDSKPRPLSMLLLGICNGKKWSATNSPTISLKRCVFPYSASSNCMPYSNSNHLRTTNEALIEFRWRPSLNQQSKNVIWILVKLQWRLQNFIWALIWFQWRSQHGIWVPATPIAWFPSTLAHTLMTEFWPCTNKFISSILPKSFMPTKNVQ